MLYLRPKSLALLSDRRSWGSPSAHSSWRLTMIFSRCTVTLLVHASKTRVRASVVAGEDDGQHAASSGARHGDRHRPNSVPAARSLAPSRHAQPQHGASGQESARTPANLEG